MPTLKIPGMSCQHCVASITKALQAVKGVTEVSVDLARKEATYAGTDVDPVAVRKAITAIGFDVAE
ncbi:MAG: heavy metal-associated domain-containing protein [Thermodesulfobacteriota bacterium]